MRKQKLIFKNVAIFILPIILLGLTVSSAFAIYKEEAKKEETKNELSSREVLREEHISNLFRDKAEDDKDKYVAGEIIIKFKDEAGKLLDKNIEKTTLKLAPGKTGLASIDSLNTKHKVKTISPVFNALKEKQLKSGKSVEALFQEIKDKFPKRSKRAPQDAKISNLSNIYKIELEEKQADINFICAEYEKDPNVEYCQPNYIIETRFVPNDPYYSSFNSWGQGYEDLWGLKKIQVEPAWDITQGEGVVVAVVDTGLDYNHPDIQGNVWLNPGEIPDNGIDDDNNGYIDDIRGWDFGNNDNDPWDPMGHGTHVSGTIAAIGNNANGVIGVAPKAKIMPVKGFSDDESGSLIKLAQSIVYAAENGADVINNSWGCSMPCPSNRVVENAVRRASGLGVVVVFAAGNSSNDIAYYSPENMTDPKPIVVSASGPMDSPSSFTSFGILVDVAAPGGGSGNMSGTPSGQHYYVDILSLRAANTDLYLGAPNYTPGEFIIANDYYRARGTSMAAPHVSGAAALILAHYPSFTNDEVRQVLRVSADDVGSPDFDIYTGAGRINVDKAVKIDSVLKVKINTPASGSTLTRGNTVTIYGTAAGEGFQSYELSFGEGLSPAQWITIGSLSEIPVENGILGSWIIGNDLLVGSYTLKLTATSTDGLTFQDFTNVVIEPPLIQITSDPYDQRFAVISGDKIVWEDYRNENYDVYLYDLSANVEQQITTNSTNEWYPDISGDKIVFWGGQSSSLNGDIYLYDLRSGSEQQITTLPSTEKSPKIFGNYIVWEDYRRDDWHPDIYLYDLSTNTERKIATGSNPKVSGDKVVYQDSNDIFLYDLATNSARLITLDGYSLGGFDYSISGDKIALGIGNTILIYNLSNDTIRQITVDIDPAIIMDFGGIKGLSISGNRIVWYDHRNGNYDIYLYDLSTNQEHRITANLSEQFFPAISGNKIVWTDWRNGTLDLSNFNFDIYMYELPFLCGDINADGLSADVFDVATLINYVFRNGPAPENLEAADLNADGEHNILDVVLLIDYAFQNGPAPSCGAGSSSFSSGATSVGLSSAATLSDGTKRVYLNGTLTIPTLGAELALTYNPSLVKIKGVYKTSRTQGLNLYLKDDLNGNAKIGLLKPDGSTWIDSGVGSLLELQFIGNVSSVKLTGAVSVDKQALEIPTTITQATVPVPKKYKTSPTLYNKTTQPSY